MLPKRIWPPNEPRYKVLRSNLHTDSKHAPKTYWTWKVFVSNTTNSRPKLRLNQWITPIMISLPKTSKTSKIVMIWAWLGLVWIDGSWWCGVLVGARWRWPTWPWWCRGASLTNNCECFGRLWNLFNYMRSRSHDCTLGRHPDCLQLGLVSTSSQTSISIISVRWLANRTHSHLPHYFWSWYEYIIHHQSEDSRAH